MAKSTLLITFRNIEHIWQLCWRLGFYRGGAVFMSALSGIDIALWDLKGTSAPENDPPYNELCLS